MSGQRWRTVIGSLGLVFALVVGTVVPTQAQPGPAVTDYYHVDALGSLRNVTNEQGVVITRYDYAPFGDLNSPCTTAPDGRLFTGHERDRETCLDYLGARYYRSTDGRFLTLDPALNGSAALGNPQRWNRYAYALNNPLKFSDPDGRSATLVGSLVGGAIGSGLAVIQGKSWQEIGAAAVGGAVSGAIFGSVVDTFGATLPVALGAGAVAGVGGTVAENALNGRGTSGREAAISAAAGAAGAGIGAAASRALSVAAQPAQSFFTGSTYSPKVLRQMHLNDFHGFPESVAAFESSGRTFWRTGGDGVSRLWLEIPGAYRGYDGVFQFIKEADGTINHRIFIPNTP